MHVYMYAAALPGYTGDHVSIRRLGLFLQGSAREEKSTALLVSFEQLSFPPTSIPMIALAFGLAFAFARKDFVVSESSDRSGSSHLADSAAGAALQLGVRNYHE